MDNQHPLTPDGFRTAAYLAARERLDFRSAKGPKCNPPNRVCGDRCIPPNWNCRVKGEGTDSHSRVVAGDPLAGAASIARGRRRLVTGFKKGSLVDIQGGRAAIERGIVKAVPGQNIKQKEALRKNVNKVLLPVATAVFGIWALQRGHEGMKLLVPQYRNGIGRDIETSMTSAVSWGLDRVPFSGQLRVQERRRAGLEAQRLGRAVSRGVSFDPANAGGGERYFPHVSTRERRAFTGLDTAIKEAYARKGSGNYANFRSDLMGSTIGANVGGKSLYSEVATAHHLARQFSIDPSTITNRDGAGSRFHIENRLSTALTSARTSMRQDMLQRGLDPKNATDVNRYVEIARSSAAPRMRGLNPDQQQGANDMLGGYIRDIVSVGKTSKDEISTRTIASGIFEETQKGFDKSFGDFARTIKEDTSPTTRVIASGEAGGSIRTALVGTANRVKRDVGLADSYTIRGANHAELVLQKVWYEKVVPGNYSGRTRSTWNATSDGAIRYAAQDMGWTGSNTDDAVEFLRANGFPRLARRPSGAAASRPARPATGAERPARRRLRSRSELISMLMRGTNGLSPEAAAAEADRIIARRGDEDDFAPELVRTATYLAARADFKENPRLGKPCGASYIPKAHECSKGRGAGEQLSRGAAPRGRAIGAAVALTAGAGLTVGGLLAYRNRAALVPGLSQEAIRKLSTAQVKAGLDKLPEQFREPARKLVGDAKLAAAHMALRAQGAQIKAVDVDHNFSTWVTANGTHLSIGSVGDSLLTFGAERKANIGKFPQFGLGFTINTTYDAEGGMPSGQARQLLRTTKAMYKAQLDMLPDDAFLFAVPHKADGKGAKRKSIYEGFGFKAIPGLKGDKLWALKNQGKFTEIPEDQFDMLRNMIRGDAVDEKKPPRIYGPA